MKLENLEQVYKYYQKFNILESELLAVTFI